ncbi:hypothetical protein [Halorubrum sp. 48-1-W]|nr:hypothetical protein [Halorubrum sp. 48-1-W]
MSETTTSPGNVPVIDTVKLVTAPNLGSSRVIVPAPFERAGR